MNTAVRRLNLEISKRFCCLFFIGRVAVRETDDGTWFIQELCKELEENGEMLDLLTLFTNVNRRVANKVSANEKYQSIKQMPVVQSTLTRKVFFSSNEKRSSITITADVTSILERTNQKLDHITKMLEDKKRSLPVSKVETARKQGSSGRWDSQQTSKQTNPMPQEANVFQLAGALGIFLEEEGNKLEHYQKRNGEMILKFLSGWETFKEDLKQYAYNELILYFSECAKDWKWYKILAIPDSSTVSGHRFQRYGSLTDVPDAGSSRHRSCVTVHRTSSIRKSNIQN
jgi:hypothetical protein